MAGVGHAVEFLKEVRGLTDDSSSAQQLQLWEEEEEEWREDDTEETLLLRGENEKPNENEAKIASVKVEMNVEEEGELAAPEEESNQASCWEMMATTERKTAEVDDDEDNPFFAHMLSG